MTNIRPIKFAHILYRTRRYEQMLRWYEIVFGAKVQYQDPGLAFLTYDDEHHRFAFANMETLQPEGAEMERQGSIGTDHVAYTYASLRDLLENYERLKGEGIEPYWCIHHGITVSLYYEDPDGNQMEFQVDSLESAKEAVDFFATRWAANPLGVEFAPEEWLSRLRAGASESEFLVRQANEPVSPLRGEITKFLSSE